MRGGEVCNTAKSVVAITGDYKGVQGFLVCVFWVKCKSVLVWDQSRFRVLVPLTSGREERFIPKPPAPVPLDNDNGNGGTGTRALGTRLVWDKVK